MEQRAAPERLHPRRRAALSALLAVALAGAGWKTAAPPPQPARLVFARQEHDFGRVQQGDVVAVEFAFANRGDIELALSTPRVARDCRAELVPQGDVAPGESGTLRVRFDTDRAPGAQRRTVTLYSSDPDLRSVTLTLHGEVTLDVAAEPAEIYVGDVAPGTRLDAQAFVRTGSRSTAVHAARSDGPYLSAELVDDTPDPAVALRIRDDAPLGPFTQSVRVLTSSKRHPSIEIPVHGIIVAAPEPSRWSRE